MIVSSCTFANHTKQMSKPSKSELMTALSNAFEQGDLQFIETVHNVAYGYKVDLKRTIQNEQRLDKNS